MTRRITQWHSPSLDLDMPIVAYGQAGQPLLMFPTAAADYLEYERFNLIQAIQHHIDTGRVRLYSINSVNRQSLMNEAAPPWVKAEYLARYDRYVEDEVVPFIHQDGANTRIMAVGASLGAYLSANAFFRRPDLFLGFIGMGGTYDIRHYMQGYYDDNVYFNNPTDYNGGITDEAQLERFRSNCQIHILTGQGAWEKPSNSIDFSNLLNSKGIPNNLDVWGHDVAHDWPWWYKMMDYYIDRLF